MVNGQPVGGDLLLGGRKGFRTAAYLLVEVILDEVLLVETRARLGRFRPEIRNVIRAPELEGYEVVNFILTRLMGGNTILLVHGIFFLDGNVAHALRAKRGVAEHRLRQLRIDRTGRTGTVW